MGQKAYMMKEFWDVTGTKKYDHFHWDLPLTDFHKLNHAAWTKLHQTSGDPPEATGLRHTPALATHCESVRLESGTHGIVW